MTIVQSLWVGSDLSKMEIYSIKSFLRTGHTFHLYTYDKINNIPKGVIVKDANEILPKKTIFTLKNLYLPFSDIFRYKMLYEKGNYWVDVDLISMRPLDFTEPFVFASERTIQKGAYKLKAKYVTNNCILKAPAKSKFYKDLFEVSMAYHKKGPNKDKIKYLRLLRKMVEKYKYQRYIKSPNHFCHLDWWYAKDAFLPLKSFRSKYGVRGHSINSMFGKGVQFAPYTIHLWRSLVTHKYKLDPNDDFHPNSLWERLIRFIDDKPKI